MILSLLLLLVVSASLGECWEIQLAAENTFGLGRLELRPNADSAWGTVCGPIDSKTATNLCKLLNRASDSAFGFSGIDGGLGLIRASQLTCLADTNFDAACSFTESTAGLRNNTCTHVDDVGLSCLNASAVHADLLFNVTYSYTKTPNIATMMMGLTQLFPGTKIGIQPDKQASQPGSTLWSELSFSFSLGSGSGSVAAWMVNYAFATISPWKLFKELGIVERYDSSNGFIPTNVVKENPTTWQFRLVSVKPAAGTYGLSGRLEVKPGRYAPWGTICSSGSTDGAMLSPAAAASLCNSVLRTTNSTPYNVLVLPYYGGDNMQGPVYLSGVDCSETNPMTFLQGCQSYVLSTPRDRDLNTCDHGMDVGVNCIASQTYNPMQATFTAYVPTPRNALDSIQSIPSVVGVPAYRVNVTSVTSIAIDTTKVEFFFAEPSASDVFQATASALEEWLTSINSQGLWELFGITELTFTLSPRVASSPVPISQPSHQCLYTAVFPMQSTPNEFLLVLAQYLSSRPFVFTIQNVETVNTNNLQLRVSFVINWRMIPGGEFNRLNDELMKIARNNTLFANIGVSDFSWQAIGAANDVSSDDDDTSNGRMLMMILAVLLVVGIFTYLVSKRSRVTGNGADAQYSAMLNNAEDQGSMQSGNARRVAPDDTESGERLQAIPISASDPFPSSNEVAPESEEGILTGRIIQEP